MFSLKSIIILKRRYNVFPYLNGIKIVIRQDTKWKTALLRCRKYSIEKIRLYDLICTFAID